MKIIVNGREETQSFAGETLQELLTDILKKKAMTDHGFQKIRVNEENVSLDAPGIRQTPVSQIQALEIDVSSLEELLERNVSNACDYLERFIPGVEKAAHLFRNGNEQEANQFFLYIIDGMDWFSQIVSSVIQARKLDIDNRLFAGRSLRQRQTQLLDLSQQILEANKNQDWVLVADLLEYEILPYYQEWTTLLPEIHRAGGNSGG